MYATYELIFHNTDKTKSKFIGYTVTHQFCIGIISYRIRITILEAVTPFITIIAHIIDNVRTAQQRV